MQVDNNYPVVTAVLPCHNHEKWVQSAVQSIVDQDYPKSNLRIMVVDDGSTDRSSDAVRAMLDFAYVRPEPFPDGVRQTTGHIQEIPVIITIRPEAGGPSVARNLGMRIGMQGTDIFALLDSDDMYHPRKIKASVEKFVLSERIGAVYSDYDTFHEASGRRVREFKEPFSRDRIVQECIVNCDSLVLAKAVAECGGFDEEMRVCEDYDFWMRISEKFVIHHIPESLVTIRVGEHSSTSNVKSEVWQANWRRIRIKAEQRRLGHAV